MQFLSPSRQPLSRAGSPVLEQLPVRLGFAGDTAHEINPKEKKTDKTEEGIPSMHRGESVYATGTGKDGIEESRNRNDVTLGTVHRLS